MGVDSINTQKKKFILLIVMGVLTVFAVVLLILKLTWTSKEYTAIQSIIENLSNYQDEIESWGYQVSVFDLISGNMGKEDDFALINYVEGVSDPVLILTDQTGGRWYFYNGFDQYAQEMESMELTPLMGGGEEVLKIVTQLQLYKTQQNRPPLKENSAEPDTKDYYDVTIEMNFDGYSQETGEHVHIKNSGLYDTQYCSNNFKECKRFWGIDPVRANRTANMCIKERFTAEQLLAFYQQGLTLQDKLMALVYHE